MDFRRFEGCCGATEIYDIGDIRSFERVLEDVVIDVQDNNTIRPHGSHLVIVTVNNLQTVAMNSLKHAGFRKMRTWKNASSGNRVTMYSKLLRIPMNEDD